jgi:hypothetical protein
MIALLVRLIRHVADIWLRIICDMRLHTNYPAKPTSRPTFLNRFARIGRAGRPTGRPQRGAERRSRAARPLFCSCRLESPVNCPSGSRRAFGFLTLIHVLDGPERYGAFIFFEMGWCWRALHHASSSRAVSSQGSSEARCTCARKFATSRNRYGLLLGSSTSFWLVPRVCAARSRDNFSLSRWAFG